MTKAFFCICLLAFCCYSCQSDSTTKSEAPSKTQADQAEPADQAADSAKSLSQLLIVNIDNCRLRKTPGPDGEILAELADETILEDLGERSDFNSTISLRGLTFDEPWVKVKSPDGQEGWVFCGGIHFMDMNQSELSKEVTRQRMRSIFGATLNGQIEKYRAAYQQVKSSEDFAQVYREGEALRKEMVAITEEKFQDPAELMPNLFWMEQAMPGYVTALVAEGTVYYLLKDYKQWQQLASKTTAKDDDAYVDVRLLMHGMDSIEYFYPSWFLQTWDYGGHSLLGQGVHQEVLQLMETAWQLSDQFHPEIVAVKKDWLADIVDDPGEGGYWESQKKILAELDVILKGQFDVLQSQDRVALETRRKMFAKPKTNQLKLNQRTR